jgi:YfiH family protein
VSLRGQGAARRLTLPLLDAVPGLIHAYTVKGSDPAAALADAAGVPMNLTTCRQVHGAAVHRVTDDAQAGPPPEADALITRNAGSALGVWVADCAPILICDPEAGAIAAVHAGWRGTAAGVLTAALTALRLELGARPASLRVAFGPAIGPCCFEVGDEVVEALLRFDPGARAAVRGGPRPRVDLIEANRRQAIAWGVPASGMQSADLCTSCHAGLLESYRRGKGRAGRMAGMLAWRR